MTFNELTKHVGEDVATMLSRKFGGMTIYIPNKAMKMERDCRIRKLHDAGWPVSTLSREYDLSERSVERILRKS